ncbi:hypothetical protein ACFTWF_22315 [Rhodococcus sp. NPDC056960]|uniref:hypothetical protein n=1 Tax=Rhodococcus sp. NPDC056960 TaxID=3345982 RepID=UPI003644E5D1
MSTLELHADDVERCTRLAEVLIPGTESMPSVRSLPSFEGLLRTAVRACGYEDKSIQRAIESLPSDIRWDSVEKHASESPEEFHLCAVLVSAAYYMAPQVLAGLSYPVNRRHPAKADEFAEEFGTGILDPVMEREKLFRDPRAH